MLAIEPLSRKAFEGFGDVLELDGMQPELINGGMTLKFSPLTRVQVDSSGVAQLCLYRSEPVELPFTIQELERHPLACQIFVPLHKRPFPVVVAEGAGIPGAGDIRVFMTNGRQGINLHPGVWHHHQLSLGQESDYLVIEREREEGNLELCRIQGRAVLQI